MPLTDRQGRSSSAPRRSGTVGFALRWRWGWALGVLFAANILLLTGLLKDGRTAGALFAGAAPAIIGLMLYRTQNRVSQTLLVLNWAVGAVVAGALTGGVGGPLAAWCLMPLAEAITSRRSSLIALGGALSFAAAAASGAASLVIAPPMPEPILTAALGFTALTLTVGAFASSVAAAQGAESLRQTLAGQPQMLLTVDAKGWIRGLIGHAPSGIPAEKLLGANLLDAAAPGNWGELEAALRAAIVTGQAEAGFTPVDDPDGWAVATLRRVDSNRIVGAIRDGSAQRLREAELVRAREEAEAANAGKSRFLANMSHELRTPLNAIMGFSDIMRQRLFGPLSDRYGEYSELIHESGSHLLELINDILDMSKIEADRYELARDEFDARDAIAAVLRLMRGQAERAGINLRGVLAKDSLNAYADRRAIKQIVLNLISNALKFTLRGGSVTISAQKLDEMLEIVVADTGVGISAEDLARLGRPYEQAGGAEQRVQGTGLGLSLVRAFAELHGGTMTIESVLGEGTSVTVRLPVLETAKAVPPLQAPERVG